MTTAASSSNSSNEATEPALGYAEWLKTHFRHVASKPLAERHHRFWRWIAGARPEAYQRPFIAIWPRGGGKSSTLELGVTYVGVHLTRRFVLIVSETQDQANSRVEAIRTLLERLGEKPATTSRGTVKGWRMDRIRTARGFNVAGIGLDAAARGMKLDEFRPDWIALDDIDGLEDTPIETGRKELTLTASILGTGAEFCLVSGTQNLILENGIFDRIRSGTSDYLTDAIIDGPEPAVLGLETEIYEEEDGRRLYRITAGEATWSGRDLAQCERDIQKLGLTAFRREMQHEVYGAQGWMFDPDRIVVGPPNAEPFRSVVTMDLAATENGGDWTVIGHFAELTNERVWALDLVRVQKEPNGVIKTILDFVTRALERDPKTTIVILQDPGSAGVSQRVALYNAMVAAGVPRLQLGCETPKGSKAVRARRFAELVNSGRFGIVPGAWNEPYRAVLRAFREDGAHKHDDDVDATSSACLFLAKGTRPRPRSATDPTENSILRRILQARERLLG